MNVLYIVGTCLSKNTSANMSHNAYIKGLLDNKCNVDVIMASDSWGEYDSALPRWNSVHYFEYKSASFIDKVRMRISSELSVQKPESNLKSTKKSNSENGKKYLRGYLKKMYYTFFPLDPLYPLEKIWLKKATKFKSKKNYDLVISNSSPAASHKLVVNLSKKSRISYKRWIQIWEDPWYYDLYGGHSEKIKEEEHFLLQQASEVYYVSPLTLEYQKKYYCDCAFKMKYIPLPYLKIYEEINVTEDKNSFGYFGDYYSQTRNLLPFYKALVDSEFKGYIYGDSDLELKETKNIEIQGRTTLERLAKVQNKVHVLVHVCNLRGGQIPGKIYHYSSTKKPILFILDGTTAEKEKIKSFFEKFDRYYFCENETESIRSAMLEIYGESDNKLNIEVSAFEPKNVVKEIL